MKQFDGRVCTYITSAFLNLKLKYVSTLSKLWTHFITAVIKKLAQHERWGLAFPNLGRAMSQLRYKAIPAVPEAKSSHGFAGWPSAR